MKVSVLAIVAACAAFIGVNAECPNRCSGHGRCTNYAAQFSTGMAQYNKPPAAGGTVTSYGYDTSISKKDSCTCFTKIGHDGSSVYAWTGPDCSLKTCPYGKAHGGTPGADSDHTSMEECSGAGACNRKNGQCECHPGFTGHNCGRTVCPNDCSGNGQCKTLKQIAVDVKNANGNFEFATTNVEYNDAFDAEQARACVCDKTWRGPDCGIKECPSGSDPMGGKGSESGRSCSGRGTCKANGECACYTGFFGTRCELQRSNVF